MKSRILKVVALGLSFGLTESPLACQESVKIVGIGIARELFGIDAEVVRGFPGANDIWLAMERGEIDGQVIDLSAIMAARPELWRQGKLRVLVQFARTSRLPEIDYAPTARELVTDQKDRAYLEFAESPFFMAMPFAAPPDIPAERAGRLESAFMDMAKRPAFRAEMLQAGMLTSPIDGNAVRRFIHDAARVPADVRARLGELLLAK